MSARAGGGAVELERREEAWEAGGAVDAGGATATREPPHGARMNERSFTRERAVWPGAPRVETEGRAEVLGEPVAFRLFPGRVPGLWPVLGLHGLGSDSSDLVEVVREAGAPAVLLDLPGFGDSGRPDRSYPVARAAAAAVALLDLLGLARPVWLGCSYGGHVALRAALDSGPRVRSLVLVDAGGLDPAPNPALAALFDERLLAARPLPAVMASLSALVATPTPASEAFRARRLRAHLSSGAHADYRAIGRSALGALADDAGRRLEAVAAPAVLLHGERDLLVPARVAQDAAARLPRAELSVLPGVGHMPWLEAPLEVAARVRLACRRAATEA